MSDPLISLKLAGSYWADQGANLLVNGDFETAGGPPPTGWGSIGSVPYRTAGARPGSSGAWMCEIGWDGVNISGRATQNAFVVGRRYHPFGWYQTDGTIAITAQDGLGGITIVGPASAAWVRADGVGVAAHARFDLMNNGNLAAGKYVRFDDWIVYEQFMYTPNAGILGGRVQIGDGRTSTTFPTQLGRAEGVNGGMRFDGGDYLLWNQALANGTYTFCALMTRGNTTAKYILDARAAGGTGYIWLSGVPALESSGGTIYVDEAQTTTLNVGPLSFVSVSGITLSAPSAVALFTFNGIGASWLGSCYALELHAGTKTPRQLRDIRQRMLARVWS